jgi:hypothetical protein
MIMVRLFSIFLITFSLAACAKPNGTQATLADQCIWNMVGYGCTGVDDGRPSVAAATGTAQATPDQR